MGHHVSTKFLRTLKQGDESSFRPDVEMDMDLVLADLHLSEKWSLLLVRSNNGIKTKHVEDRKHGSYILAAGYGQIEDVVEDIREQITKLKANRDWNPRARFLILLKQRDVFTEDSLKISSEDIFTELWKFRVVNVVILTRALKTRLGEADTGRKILPVLEAFTWFPYRTSASCGEVRDAVPLDRWIPEGNGHFLYNNSLYPRKIPKDFRGCPLRVSAFEYPPVMMGMKEKENGKFEYEEGIEMRLLLQMARRTNMSISYRPPPADNGYWGNDFGNGSWSGLSGEIIRGYSDIALDNFWYRCHLINDMECLVPHFMDSARWFVPCAKHYPRWTSITRVFEAYLWLGFLVSYIIVALFMWLVVKISHKIPYSDTNNEAYASLVECFLNFWAVILGESASNNPPQVFSIRFVFLMWVLYCWAFNTVYQTFLTSYLVDSGLQSQISSEEELLNSGMPYGVHKVLIVPIPHLASSHYPRRIDCVTFEYCQDRAAFKGDLAFVFSALNMEYVIAKRYMDGNGKPLICIFDEVISNQIISLPVPKGLPMMDELNNVIQDVIEAGLLEQWLKNIEYTATLASARNFIAPAGEYTKLTLEHLQSPFYFLFLGYALSVIAFITEFISHWK
jgi:ionotropic kainate glutamate receptor 3/ionotropic kainate glutamate receptor 5